MAVGNGAIDRLRLDEAFASLTSCSFNECWTVRMDSRLMVVDDDQRFSRFSDDIDEEQKSLIIINTNNREIVLLSVDNRLISNYEGGIADCALFDLSQFRFVEFKTNAYGNSDESIRDTFDKAVNQLKNTLKLFTERLKSVNSCLPEVICHIVVSHGFPKSRAVKQEYQLAFANDTGLYLDFSEKTYWDMPV